MLRTRTYQPTLTSVPRERPRFGPTWNRPFPQTERSSQPFCLYLERALVVVVVVESIRRNPEQSPRPQAKARYDYSSRAETNENPNSICRHGYGSSDTCSRKARKGHTAIQLRLKTIMTRLCQLQNCRLTFVRQCQSCIHSTKKRNENDPD
jgi:hypothetical protein